MADSPVQITDQNGNLVGTADMLDAFKKQLIRHTVYVMLVDSDGHFMLQKRSQNTPNYPGHWDATAGGHVDIGETHEEAAYRELAEEIGLSGVPIDHNKSFYFETKGDGRVYRYYSHLYTGIWPKSARFELSNQEVSEVKPFSVTDFDRLTEVTPITKHIVGLL